MAPSISLEEARDTVLRFERKLMAEFPEVERVVSRVGRGEVGAHADPVNNAESFVGLKPPDEWSAERTGDVRLSHFRSVRCAHSRRDFSKTPGAARSRA